jgi:pimeloyl-ACP methyl ester carboxylesterase
MSQTMEANLEAGRQRAAVSRATSPRRDLGTAPGTARVDLGSGLQLAYDEHGAGQTVVCLHAVAHGASDFAALGARLAPRYRVLAPDWPGHGWSSDDREPPTALRYAAILGRFLDALALRDVVLVGNSIGGAAAIAYAARHPERVRGLVVENPGGLDPQDRLAAVVIAAMVRFFAAGARGASWFPAAYGAYYRLVLPARAAAEQRRRVVAAGSELAPLLRDAWRGFGEPGADRRADLRRVACPTLVAWAERDRFVQLRRARPALRALPHATLRRFPAGHAAHLETPDAFAEALERFLGAL